MDPIAGLHQHRPMQTVAQNHDRAPHAFESQGWFRREHLQRDPALCQTDMERFRHMGDPLGDACLAELRAHRIGLGDAYPALLDRARDPHSVAHALLDDMRRVPEWVNFDVMRAAGAMAQRNFPIMIMALTYGALPLVFVHPDSAAIFGGTGHFAASIPRRLKESALLFFGVTDTDALRPDARMWQVCLRVRLIHAAVRHQFLQRPDWDTAQRGIPISALQTAAGPAFFGTRLLEGMRGLGAVIDPQEALGHLMVWRYVTQLLGVPAPLIGATQEDQDAFDNALMPLAFAPDERSRELVAAVLEGLREGPQTRRIPPHIQSAMMRSMLGHPWADSLGVPPSDESTLQPVVTAFHTYSRWARTPLLAWATQRLGQYTLHRLASTPLVTPNPRQEAS
jgi:hypothetical protein